MNAVDHSIAEGRSTGNSVDKRWLRVAYVVYRFDVGGLERCVAHLCNHLDRERFRPMVICLSRSGSASEWLQRGDVDVVALEKKPRNDLGVIGRLARVLRERRVEVVHSHNWGTLLETSLARRRAAVPVHVHTEHGQGLHDGLRGPRQWIRRGARRWAFERLDALAVCAESVRPLIRQQCGFPEERMVFLPNGVEEPSDAKGRAGALRRELGLAEGAFVVGSVGRLTKVKDFGVAIDAVARLASQGQDVHLVLVGDGPEESPLRKRAQQAEVGGRVHLVGRHENIGDWLRLFDVYLNTSRSEAMSMGILEAMAAGRPMVVTNVGDNGVLVDGRAPCGLVVPPRDPAALAAGIAELVADSARRGTMAGRARRRYEEQYSIACMAAQHGNLYRRLLQRRVEEGRCSRSA